jgi:hypothetical protein
MKIAGSTALVTGATAAWAWPLRKACSTLARPRSMPPPAIPPA